MSRTRKAGVGLSLAIGIAALAVVPALAQVINVPSTLKISQYA